MTFANWTTLVRMYTKTNSTTFPNADILLYANIFKDELAEEVGKKVDEDYFGLRLERDLIAGQREYELPAQLMSRIKYLEAKLDGTDWVKLYETDLSAFQKSTDEATIVAAYAGKPPAFDVFDRTIFLYTDSAIIEVDAGLKLWATLFPADFTDLTLTTDMEANPTTTSHGFPRQLHELLARRVSIAYKSSKDRPIPLSEKEQLFDKDLANKLDLMKGLNLDRATIPALPVNDGSDY